MGVTVATRDGHSRQVWWSPIAVAAGFLNKAAASPQQCLILLGYIVSRGLAKSGSREPYFTDGSNAERADGENNR